ncbi:amidase family protein [Nocardioides sp. InS609-2]|uniref:amidase family protein n=1 Tax=Nocardioides sp. InS609-2 TaxID=2760705 RepID=UPI0024A65095|nr:amidase family protein [Nocardioides sp. InS609-2]
MFLAYAQPGPTDIDFGEFIEHEHRRMSIRAAWQAYHRDVDVFLCPVNFTTAIPHDDRPFEQRRVATTSGPRPYTDQSFWTAHASLPGLPAVSAPIRTTAGGLPIGIQIIGPRYEDDTAITFAELLAAGAS